MTIDQEPLHFVPNETILANASLSLAFNNMVHPDVSAVANGIHQGMTGKKPVCLPGHRKSVWYAAYSFGVLMAQFLNDTSEEEEECPEPTSSSAPTKRLKRPASPAASSSGSSTTVTSNQRSGAKARATATSSGRPKH